MTIAKMIGARHEMVCDLRKSNRIFKHLNFGSRVRVGLYQLFPSTHPPIGTVLLTLLKMSHSSFFFLSCGMAVVAIGVYRNQTCSSREGISLTMEGPAANWFARSTSRLLLVSASIELLQNCLQITSLTLLPASVMVLLQLGLDVVVISIAVSLLRGRWHSFQRLAGIMLIAVALLIVAVSLITLSHADAEGGSKTIWAAFGYLLARACRSEGP